MATKSMKLILQEDVNKLGEAGELVEVKPGYGRNYLIPQHKARMATEAALKQRKRMREAATSRAEQTVEEAKALADKLNDVSVTVPVQVGETGRIHGSVTTQDIEEALKEHDIDIDRKKITIDHEIQATGEFTATIELIAGLEPQIKVWVVKK